MLTEKFIRDLSKRKNEPSWMLKLRLDSLKKYQNLPLPNFGPDLSGLNLAEIETYVEPTTDIVSDWKNVPKEIRETFETLGIPEAERASLAGVGAQYDSEMVYHNLKSEVEKLGVVYEDLGSALNGPYKNLIREKFMSLLKNDEHKFLSLHGAVWSGGSFVYVPKNVSVEIPLQAYFRLNEPGAGQFEHTLIIVEEGAYLHFIEGCSAPKYNTKNLHAGCVEIFVGKNARVRYSTVENWGKNMYNLNSKRALVEKGGRIEWVSGSFGSFKAMLYPCSVLAGKGASADFLGISLASKDQDLDTGAKMIHLAPETSSVISSKSIVKGGGKSTFRSLVYVDASAKNSCSSTDCNSLILDENSISDTIPKMTIKSGDANIGHEAKIGKISDKTILYLRSRGFSEAEARSLIVSGFAEQVVKELPIEYAVEMNNLITHEIEGTL